MAERNHEQQNRNIDNLIKESLCPEVEPSQELNDAIIQQAFMHSPMRRLSDIFPLHGAVHKKNKS